MKVSQLLGTSLRKVAPQSGLSSLEFLRRAGFVRHIQAGERVYLHLGMKTILKIQQLVQKRLEAFSGGGFQLPIQNDKITHQGTIVAQLLTQEISSYKQLPLSAHTHVRLNRTASPSSLPWPYVNQAFVSATYLCSSSAAELNEQLEELQKELHKLMQELGVKVKTAKVSLSIVDSQFAESIMYPVESGGERFLIESQSAQVYSLAATKMKQELVDHSVKEELEKVHTPSAKTIDELCQYLGVSDSQTAKVVFYSAEQTYWERPKLLLAVVRGDMDVNEQKLRRLVLADTITPASEEEIINKGCVPGFASPIGMKREGVIVVVDDRVANTSNLVAGANEIDFHFRNANYGRDYEADMLADISLAHPNTIEKGGGVLSAETGIVLSHVEASGTTFTEPAGASFMNEQGRPEAIQLGIVNIWIDRLMGCIAESHQDEYGLMWPMLVAPYQLVLVSLADSPETISQADSTYDKLTSMGIEVLYDDRPKKMAGPGVKFKDADLQGIPIRMTLSRKTMEVECVECKLRSENEKILVPFEEVDAWIQIQLT